MKLMKLFPGFCMTFCGRTSLWSKFSFQKETSVIWYLFFSRPHYTGYTRIPPI